MITDGAATSANFSKASRHILDIIKVAVDERADLVQIREKQLTARELFELSAGAAAITRSSGTRLLINDRADVAFAAGADGVHLAGGSLPTGVIRAAFPATFLIGVSTHSTSDAEAAAVDGADFAVFGPIFDTPNKRPAIGIKALEDVCKKLGRFPIVALGGVDAENYRSVLNAGASGVAGIRAFNDRESLRNIRQLRNEY
jgi:thiamine-phosphate pyrophosphorylase